MEEPQLRQEVQKTPHKKEPSEEYLSLSRDISELLARLRLLEERYANLRREHHITGHNMVENHQSLSKQLRKQQESITLIRRDIAEIGEQISTMKGELSDAAKSHELKVLLRYLDFWEPMQFLTRKEAEKLIQEKLYKESPPGDTHAGTRQ